jgi:hypothetical protein
MFNVKVRLFRVVTWMEEQAGAKAAAREKVRLGYDRKGPKLLGSFKAILFKAFETGIAVSCATILTNRIGRRKAGEFPTPEQTTDFGVLCHPLRPLPMPNMLGRTTYIRWHIKSP